MLPFDRLTSEGKGEPAAKYQSFKDLFDALTLCKFASLTVTQICQIYTALTGWECSAEDLLAAGKGSLASTLETISSDSTPGRTVVTRG